MNHLSLLSILSKNSKIRSHYDIMGLTAKQVGRGDLPNPDGKEASYLIQRGGDRITDFEILIIVLTILLVVAAFNAKK